MTEPGGQRCVVYAPGGHAVPKGMTEPSGQVVVSATGQSIPTGITEPSGQRVVV